MRVIWQGASTEGWEAQLGIQLKVLLSKCPAESIRKAETNPDFWPLGPLKIASDTFCKLILSFLKSTPVTLLAITKQNPTGLQSSCISKNEAFGEFLNRAALVFLLLYWQVKHLWLENWAVTKRLLRHPSGKQSPLLSIPNHLRTPVGTTAFQQLRSYWQTRFVNHQTTKSP